jgi:arginyl-tRNA synthetase
MALETADPAFARAAALFDAARNKRNDFSYDTPIPISDTDARDLLVAVEQFQREVERWIRSKTPGLA